ncbi:6-phosphogluconolactonase [Thiohalobacter sp. IOR34]|uniref:6-phosphogluconolactonase n=1 Tax=Thiohalobacter sp. IOR34 TaxID=3057176 RepID=UPI0025B1F5E1|nr:6-phosphogluconolactonase [Thiohalobacter sp. IOR34]WJW75901.1 6-phosphogluconolactonase [Thiohalobacter sp. IOR34]
MHITDPRQVSVLPSPEALAEAAARRIDEAARAAIRARGAFHIALAGGSTPRRLYRRLAESPFAEAIDWSHIHVYFGDERAVPPDHADSNYRMAEEALLSRVPIPREQIHPMRARPERIETDAASYAELLNRCLPREDGLPRLDLALLGVGPDGHTASLFPGTPVLEERQRLVAPVYVERLQSWRLTLTYPVLEAARGLLFLVAGSDKAPIVHRLFREPETGAPALPVAAIRPGGEVQWLLDAAAAEGLQP